MPANSAPAYGVREAVSGGPLAPRSLAYFRSLGGRGIPIWEAHDAAEEEAWLEGLHARGEWFEAAVEILMEHHQRGADEELRRRALVAAPGRCFREALREVTLSSAELAGSDEQIVKAVAEAFAELGICVIVDAADCDRAIRSARHAYAEACS